MSQANVSALAVFHGLSASGARRGVAALLMSLLVIASLPVTPRSSTTSLTSITSSAASGISTTIAAVSSATTTGLAAATDKARAVVGHVGRFHIPHVRPPRPGRPSRVRPVAAGAGSIALLRPSGVAAAPATTVDINPAQVTTVAGNATLNNTDGTGTAASFIYPSSVVATGGFVYVGAQGAIRKFNPANGAVTTLAGGGGDGADSNDPTRVGFDDIWSLDTDGTYLYSLDGSRVRRTSLANGATSTVFSGVLDRSLTYGPDGFLYTLQRTDPAGQTRVIRIDRTNGTVSTVATLDGYPQRIASDGTHAADEHAEWPIPVDGRQRNEDPQDRSGNRIGESLHLHD